MVACRRELAIETDGLGKRYGSRWAIESLSIGVPMAQIAGLVGPNGAGKTTTIRMLMGLVRPSAGTAMVLGREIIRPRDYLPRVGALIESPVFYPGLSGRANLTILAQLRGVQRTRVTEMLDLVGLGDRGNDPVRTYSLGMKQRLGIAMALLPDPDLLVLDEPINGLDPPGIIQVRDLLRQLRDQGKTILVSSHLLGELEQVAQWLVVLDRGRAVFNGPAQALHSGPADWVVVTVDPAELGTVERIAASAGYAARVEDGHVHVTCPDAFTGELNRRATAAGATIVEIRRSEASLEERVLALLEGEHER